MGPVGWGPVRLSQTGPIPRSPDGDNNAKYLCLAQVKNPSYQPHHQLILPQEPNKTNKIYWKIFEEKEKFCVHSSFRSTDIHLVKAQYFLERVDQKEISVQ